jgi:hypothetical protein
LIVRAGTSSTADPNAALIKLLARAHQLQHQLRHEKITSIDELASRAQMNASYATRLLRLAWLAPDITQAILHGRHLPALTADKLMRAAPVPVDWQAQRVSLGFG